MNEQNQENAVTNENVCILFYILFRKLGTKVAFRGFVAVESRHTKKPREEGVLPREFQESWRLVQGSKEPEGTCL